MKRLIVATVGGMICGGICVWLISGSGGEVAAPILWQAFFSRTLIGVAIGLSTYKMGHWILHGFILGLVFSLPLAFSGLMAPESPDYSAGSMFFFTVLLGGIYGFLIELLTTVAFKQRK